MGNWEKERKQKIEKLCKHIRIKFLGYNVFTKRTTQGILFEELENFDIVLGFDAERKIYVAWSTAGHRIIDGAATMHTFSLNKLWINLSKISEEHMCFYQRLEGQKKPGYLRPEYYEKIMLIRESCIEEFCKNPIMYLMPNKMDPGYRAGTVFADFLTREVRISENKNDGRWFSDEERERYCCSRVRRDPAFRGRVLESWGSKCAICDEDILEVLEAAHIIAVEKGGTDAAENGICLCANHHLMFDHKLFHFDANTGQLIATDDRLIGKLPDLVQRKRNNPA